MLSFAIEAAGLPGCLVLAACRFCGGGLGCYDYHGRSLPSSDGPFAAMAQLLQVSPASGAAFYVLALQLVYRVI